jgi:hypothetical protein
MKKESKLVVILLLLLPIPFFSNNCLTAFSTKFMNDMVILPFLIANKSRNLSN